MRLLALETATDACSVALACDDGVHQRFELAPQRHTQLLLPMVQALCAEAGVSLRTLDGLAVSLGPGAFTGVRVAAACAQGLALACDLPVIGLSTLATLAQGGRRLTGRDEWLVVQDARRAEVYWAHYRLSETGESTLLQPERVSAPEAVVWPVTGTPGLAGSGWQVHATRLPAAAGLEAVLHWPEAQDLIALARPLFASGRGRAAETLEPVYLRPAV